MGEKADVVACGAARLLDVGRVGRIGRVERIGRIGRFGRFGRFRMV